MLEFLDNSCSPVQRTHPQLVDAAQVLSTGTVGQSLLAETEDAILSAVSGSWFVEGYTLALNRVVSGGPGYERRLRPE